MKNLKHTLFITIVLIFFNCTVFAQFTKSLKSRKARGKAGIVRVSQFKGNKGTFMWNHYDATKRGSMIYIDPDNNVRVLAENPPDAAIQSITEITAKIKNIKGIGNIETALKAQRSIAELGKRTAAVNMMRDALYRLNEMYYASKDQSKQIIRLKTHTIKDIKIDNVSKLDSVSKSLNLIFPKIDNSIDKTNLNSDIDLEKLFESVLSKTKEIAIIEAKASIEIAKSESKISIEQAKLEQERYKTIQKALEDSKDKLTKKEYEKYLDKLLNL